MQNSQFLHYIEIILGLGVLFCLSIAIGETRKWTKKIDKFLDDL